MTPTKEGQQEPTPVKQAGSPEKTDADVVKQKKVEEQPKQKKEKPKDKQKEKPKKKVC